MQADPLARRVFFLLFFSALAVSPLRSAWAGAWLEEAGTGFASADLRLRGEGYDLGYFASYGLGERLTIGLDLNDGSGGGGHGLAFLRLPLHQRDDGLRLAFELALGANHNGDRWRRMQKYTLSAGYGFVPARGPWHSGWVSADLAREYRDAGLSRAWKLDATLGLNRRQGAAPLLQIELFRSDNGALTASILPSLRYKWRTRSGISRDVIVGLEYRPKSNARATDSLSLRFGLWQPF